jgi:hypothetical protein
MLPNRLRAKTNFVSRFNLIWAVQFPPAEIFRFPLHPNQWLSRRCSGPIRGAYRDRHERWARNAVDARALRAKGDRRADFSVSDRRPRKDEQRFFADGEVVWFWRPDAGAKFRSIRAEPNRAETARISEATVARKPGHREEHEGNR